MKTLPFCRFDSWDVLDPHEVFEYLLNFSLSFRSFLVLDAFVLRFPLSVKGWCFTRRQYSSLGEGAAGVSLGAVHMERVQVRVQVEQRRDEVNNREKQEKDKHEETDNERTIKRLSWMV